MRAGDGKQLYYKSWPKDTKGGHSHMHHIKLTAITGQLEPVYQGRGGVTLLSSTDYCVKGQNVCASTVIS